MSSLHSMKKEIAKRSLMFEPDMYNNVFGSVVISAYILSKEKPVVPVINKMWREIKKNHNLVDFWLDDPDFIDKVLDLFCMKRPKNFPIAMVQSEFNVLFMPYVEGQLFPLREDGIYPMTASKGKIYPIDFTNTHDGELAAKSEVNKNAKGQTKRNRHKQSNESK